MQTRKGHLLLVATPIGNLDDISQRALDSLKSADLICAEDTRHSGKLLRHFGIKTKTLSLHEHNEHNRIDRIVNEIENGKTIALITDAGTPAISDPGFPLVRACRELGIDVSPIPGASAVIAALCASGLPTDRFVFHGFPPETAGKRRLFFEEAAALPMTGVMYLSPHKATKQLAEAAAAFGDRPAVLAREMTKLHEEFTISTVSELASTMGGTNPKGEIVLVVGGRDVEPPDDDVIIETVTELRKHGLSGRRLADALVEKLGIRKRQAYKFALDDED